MYASNTFLKPDIEEVFVLYDNLVVSAQWLLASGFGALDKIFSIHKYFPKPHPNFSTTVLLEWSKHNMLLEILIDKVV